MKPTKADLIEALRQVNPAIVAEPYGRGLSIQVPRTFQRRLEDVCTSRGLKLTRTFDPGVGDCVTVEVFGFPRRARAGVTTRRASYRDGVAWIAANDNAGGDSPASCGTDSQAQEAMRASIAGYVSTLLLADLFGADPIDVAGDIFRRRAADERSRR